MTKDERIYIIMIAAKLEAVKNSLAEALSPMDDKTRISIIREQADVLQRVIGDLLKGDRK